MIPPPQVKETLARGTKHEPWPKLFLLLIFIALCAVLLLRIKVEATHYLTPDSHYYLRVASNILAGKGFVAPHYVDYPFSETSEEKYFATWPLGYPLLIAAVSAVTQLTPFWASKWINLLSLAGIFVLFYRWFGKRAWFPALYFFSFNMLEVYSYSWSEGPFLFLLLCLCYIIYSSFHRPSPLLFLKLFLCLSLLFLFRYAGIIYFFFTLLFGGYFLARKQYTTFWHYFSGLFLSSLLVLAYLKNNYEQSGYITGIHRIEPELTTNLFFIKSLGRGLLNTFTLARNYFFQGAPDLLYLGLLLLQLLLLALLIKNRNLLNERFLKKWRPSWVLFAAAGVYFLFILFFRRILYFDEFNYRTLAPFGLPLFIAVFYFISKRAQEPFFLKVKKWVVLFMILSLLANLPKAYLLQKIIGTTQPFATVFTSPES